MAFKKDEIEYFVFLKDKGFRFDVVTEWALSSILCFNNYRGTLQTIIIDKFSRPTRATSLLIELNLPNNESINYHEKEYSTKEELLETLAYYKEEIIKALDEFENRDHSLDITGDMNKEVYDNYQNIYDEINYKPNNIDELNNYLLKLRDIDKLPFNDFMYLTGRLLTKYIEDNYELNVGFNQVCQIIFFSRVRKKSIYPLRDLKAFYLKTINKIEIES